MLKILLLFLLISSIHSYRPVTCDQVSCRNGYKCLEGEDLAVKCVKLIEHRVRCNIVNCGDGQRCVERKPEQPETEHRRIVECADDDEFPDGY